jgi:hypothetical protein
MIEHRISSRPGRVGVIVDRAGRTIRDHAPAPVVGAAESLHIVLLDGDLKPWDPPGMADAAYLRFSICGDWDPATPPVYVTGAVTRIAVGIYEIADLSGTYTAAAVALLGREAEKPCVYELAAYAEDPETGSVWSTPLSVVQYIAPLRNRADSLLDPTTLQPADLRGPAGPAATIAVGTVTTLPAGSSATVENAGTESAAVFDFGIPQGAAGSGGGAIQLRGERISPAQSINNPRDFTVVLNDDYDVFPINITPPYDGCYPVWASGHGPSETRARVVELVIYSAGLHDFGSGWTWLVPIDTSVWHDGPATIVVRVRFERTRELAEFLGVAQ